MGGTVNSCDSVKSARVKMSDDKKAKAFRGELTKHQEESIAKLPTVEKQPRREQRAFAEAFEHACALSNQMDKLSNSDGLSRSTRAALKGSVRELENKLTPGHKRAILKRNRPIADECVKNFRKSGEPKYSSQIIESMPELSRGGGKAKPSSRLVRRVSRKTLGIKGTPGRPKKPQST
jgi:hypothetical protein